MPRDCKMAWPHQPLLPRLLLPVLRVEAEPWTGEPGASMAWALRHGAVGEAARQPPKQCPGKCMLFACLPFFPFPQNTIRSLSRALTLLHDSLVENKEMTIPVAAQSLFNRDATLSVEHLWAILSQNQMTLKGKTGQWFSRLDTLNYTVGK